MLLAGNFIYNAQASSAKKLPLPFIGQPCVIVCEGVEEIIKMELDKFDAKLFQMAVEKFLEKHQKKRAA